MGAYTAEQWGLVTTAQAAAAGMDGVTLHRLVEAGHLEPVRRGVYASTAAPSPPHRDVQAAWLSLNPAVPSWERPMVDVDGGVVSHRTATQVHQVGDMVASAIELTVPRRRTSRDPLLKLRIRHLEADEVTLVDGLPVTTPVRTVEDLLADHTEASHVATVIKQCVEEDSLDVVDLAARLGRYGRRYGVKGHDGGQVIDHLLAQIGTSRAELAERPSVVQSLNTGRGTAGSVWGPDLQRAMASLTQPIIAPMQKSLADAIATPLKSLIDWKPVVITQPIRITPQFRIAPVFPEMSPVRRRPISVDDSTDEDNAAGADGAAETTEN